MPDDADTTDNDATANYIDSLRRYGGATGQLIADHDWSASSIGPISQWGPSLRTALGILLRSPIPIVMLWNEDGVMLYNDAYSVFAGGRHPQLLGSKVREGWPEVAEFNDNVMRVGLNGGTLAYQDQELTLYRHGRAEQLWVNLDYSPVPGEDGRPAGVIAIVVETTERVLADRRAAEERHRQEAMLQHMPGFAAVLTGPDHIFTYVNDAYRAIVQHRNLIGLSVREAFPDLSRQGVFELLDDVYRSGTPFTARARPIAFGGAVKVSYLDFIYQPIRNEAGAVTGIFVGGYDVTEAKEAAERIELALDSGTILGTWVWDVTENRFTGDDRFARTFSLDAARLRAGLPLAEVVQSIHPEDAGRVDELVRQAIERGGSYAAQYRVRRGDGWAWIEASGRVEKDEAGVTQRFPGVLIDIDRRKRTEIQLENAKEQLELAQIAGGIGIFSIATGTDDLVVSPEACRIFGYEAQPVLSASEVQALMISEDRGVHSTAETRDNASAPLDVTYRLHRKSDGALRWIARRGQFIYDETGHPVQMIGIVQDVTDRRRAEVDLMESQTHLALMVESAQEYAILSVSPDGLITSWNEGASRLFGGAPSDMIGTPFDSLFVPEDRDAGVAARELKTAAADGRFIDQRWHQRVDGRRFYANGITSAMFDGAGRLSGFTKIARDMTAERLAHDALVAARDAAEVANIAKTEFLANMSHEIRTPMNAIVGLSNLLSLTQPLTPKQKQFVATLQTSADSMMALINDLLDISKIEARSVELEAIPFNLTTIVHEVASMMAVRVREKGLRFTGHGECVENRTFLGDPMRIRQIIANLCSNAIKFTDAGRVHVAITCQPHHLPDTETVCIAVSDTGVGIPSDKLESIFQKFTQADTSITRRFGGTGLGLAITRTLTEVMGGTIGVTSEPGKGSVFTVCLPLRLSDQQSLPPVPLAADSDMVPPQAMRPTVLVVEDYEPNVLVASAFLDEFGYAVDTAENGLEAFEKVTSVDYAAVLMDVQMHGMNGLDATQNIRAYEAQHNRPRVPIIGMTAHALAGDRERCLAAGMDDYVPKPFNPELLRLVLQRARDLT
ncbi:MAG: PAS domain S-box protein [Asticcacaulis sp.]